MRKIKLPTLSPEQIDLEITWITLRRDIFLNPDISLEAKAIYAFIRSAPKEPWTEENFSIISVSEALNIDIEKLKSIFIELSETGLIKNISKKEI